MPKADFRSEKKTMPENSSTEGQSPSEFVPTEGGGKTADAGNLLIAAYLLFWLIVAASIALSWRRQRALSRRLQHLEQAIASKGPADLS